MKTTTTDKVIITLTIIILTIAAILYSVQPDSTAGAVQFTAGTTAQQAHVTSESVTWTDAYHYAPKNRPALIGDCLADRVTGDLYPQPDPYCLPVPSVAVAETVKRDTDDTDAPVIVDVPATPETPAEEPPVVTPPVVEPETPEEPTTPEQPETPSNPETPEEPSQAGNPGNTKDVGNAGENPNGRGTMPNDNAGGNGNGEHGNQGEGGHHNG